MKTDGTVWCWGGNFEGELGNGTRANSSVPVQTVGISDAIDVAAGSRHSCALRRNGTIKCWGDGSKGQLGNGSFADRSLTPVDVADITNATSVTVGVYNTCARLGNGDVQCWGYPSDGIGPNVAVPRTVAGLTAVSRIAQGGYHTCALDSIGVQCWGQNDWRQLGDGSRSSRPNPMPVTVISSTPTTQISSHLRQTCTLSASDTVECWGEAVTSMTVSGAQSIAAGRAHRCAVLDSGAAVCWGENTYGALGDGSTTDSFDPRPVTGVGDLTEISAGNHHTCAIRRAGTVLCWGLNDVGELGDGTHADATTPVPVLGL